MERPFCRAALCIVSLFTSGISFGIPGHAFLLRQYPIPNAIEVPLVSNIGISASGQFDAREFDEGDLIEVVGSRSGAHKVELHLSDDQRTLILNPYDPFTYNEAVRVAIHARLMGGAILTDSFQFRTIQSAIIGVPIQTELDELTRQRPSADIAPAADTLPPMTVQVDNGATPGIIYFGNLGFGPLPNNTFLFNLDQHGQVLRQHNLGHDGPFDFKIQPNGITTYFSYLTKRYYEVDSGWHSVDSFVAVNGYTTDEHELRVFPNGGYALLALSHTHLDSSQFVPGMDSAAIVQGSVIQVFDAGGNETFEWRGIDHYKVRDVLHQNLAAPFIDFEHANSLDFDSCGNIIMSNRYLCEVTKIDGQTGAMIWRLGGAHNQFQLVGDNVWFSYQHAARLLPNDHLILFDNSAFDSIIGQPGYINTSRAVEYVLDTNSMKATLVWQFHHYPETFTVAMGNAQRLPNGNTFICWGANNDVAITEVRPDNSTVFELTMGNGNYSYRAFKYPTADSSAIVMATPPDPNATTMQVMMDAFGQPHLQYTLSQAEHIEIALYDEVGRDVSALVSSIETAGTHSLSLSGSGVAPGRYFCVLRGGEGTSLITPLEIPN